MAQILHFNLNQSQSSISINSFSQHQSQSYDSVSLNDFHMQNGPIQLNFCNIKAILSLDRNLLVKTTCYPTLHLTRDGEGILECTRRKRRSCSFGNCPEWQIHSHRWHIGNHCPAKTPWKHHKLLRDLPTSRSQPFEPWHRSCSDNISCSLGRETWSCSHRLQPRQRLHWPVNIMSYNFKNRKATCRFTLCVVMNLKNQNLMSEKIFT